MELREHEAGAASMKPAAVGTGLPMGFTFKAPTLTKLSMDACGVPGAAGVLTVSDNIVCTNAGLRAREESLSQAAVSLVRDAPDEDAAGGAKANPVIDAARVEAEISTLELLNQRDTMLCDELRASCRVGAAAAKAGGGAGGALRQSTKPSCWALLEGVGTPKQAFSSLSAPGPNGAQLRHHENAGLPRRDSGGSGIGSGDDEDNGGEGGSDARKRVFSKYDEETTSILTEWFLAHKRWPYPAAKEKDALAEATKLTTLQISNWFTNKRKRHWTPVIKKRTRSPRDFFEFCVMNPKQQTLAGKKPQQSQQTQQVHQHHQQQQQHPNKPMGGTSSYAPGEVSQRGMGPSNGMHHRHHQQMPPASGMHYGAARGASSVGHGAGVEVNGNGAAGVRFDPGGRTAMAGTANGGGWLDHARQQQHQQQPLQQQRQLGGGGGGPQHPGALAPGLVYAASKASRAAQAGPPTHDQHMPPWMNQGGNTMERRGHSMMYPHGGFRTTQPAEKGPPPPSGTSLPQQTAADLRDAPKMASSSVPQYADVRGFDASTSAYHQAQQNHEALRRRDQASGAAQLVSQQGPGQQPMKQNSDGQQYQQPAGQQQQQQQQQPSPNPGVLPPTQTVTSMPTTAPAQQAVGGNASSSLWVSYRAPSPRNLAAPPTFSPARGGNGGGAGGGDHAQYALGSYYAQGPGGSEMAQYSSAPPNPIAGGGASGGGGGGDGYSAWRGNSAGARQESFPPVAAFASSGGAGGGGVGSGAGTGVNGAASGGSGGVVGMAQSPPDPVHPAYLQRPPQPPPPPPQSQQQQQPRGSPIEGTTQQQQQQYWDRSLSGRGWPTVGSEVASLHPPPQTGSSEFKRATSSGPVSG